MTLFSSLLSLVMIKRASKNLKKLLQTVYTNKKQPAFLLNLQLLFAFTFIVKLSLWGNSH